VSASVRANEAGNAPLELIAWVVVLLVPLFPAIELQRAIADQMAAEAIARHALRSAVLLESAGEPISESFTLNIQRVALEIAHTYRVEPKGIELRVDCSRCESDELVTLEVLVSGYRAMGVMGLEPKASG
jgi:hypothetical protein